MSNRYRSILSLGSNTPSFSNTKSILLDGVDDFVNVADNNNLSFGNGTTDSPFSISTWVNINSIVSVSAFVSKYGSSSSIREYSFYPTSNKLRLLLWDANNGTNNLTTGTTVLPLNTWTHIACTYDGRGGGSAGQGVNLYVNGVQETKTTSTTSYNAMSNTTQPFKIGEMINNFDGNIDETAIFSSDEADFVSASTSTALPISQPVQMYVPIRFSKTVYLNN